MKIRCIWGTSQSPTGRYVGSFVAQRIPHVMLSSAFGAYSAVGVVDETDRLVGGVVFTNYQPDCKSIELSAAADDHRWLTRPVIGEILSYPFHQLGCQRLTAVTPRKAASARRFLEKFGFRREGLVRLGFGSDDAIITGLLRKEWDRSPLNLERVRLDGQVRSHAAAGA